MEEWRNGRAEERLGCAVRARFLLQIGHQQRLEVAVHHPLNICYLCLRPVIVDHRIRLEDIGADLTAPLDFLLGAFERILGRFLEGLLLLIDTALQHSTGAVPVLQLGALFRAFGNDFRVLSVRQRARPYQPHTRFHLVDVLAALSARTERLQFDLSTAQIHLDLVVYFRIDEYAGEGRMSSSARIKR